MAVFPAAGATYMLLGWTTPERPLSPPFERVIEGHPAHPGVAARIETKGTATMNLSGIGSILGLATQLMGGSASPLGALGSLASQALGAGQSQTGASSDPLSAIMALTQEVDGIAQSGLGGGLLGSIAGMLA